MTQLQWRIKGAKDSLQQVFNELNQDDERERKAADNLRASIQACDWAIEWLVNPETVKQNRPSLKR